MLQVIWVSWFRFAFYGSPLTPAIRQLNRYCSCCCCVLSPVYQLSYCNIISWVFSHVSLSAPRICAAETIAIKAGPLHGQHIGNLSLDRSVRAVSMLMLSQSHCQAFVKCIRKWSQANTNRIFYAGLAWKSLEFWASKFWVYFNVLNCRVLSTLLQENLL